MGDDGYYMLNEYEFHKLKPKKIDLDSKIVTLTRGEAEINDPEHIDDVIIHHEPATYNVKRKIFECRYCHRMYQ